MQIEILCWRALGLYFVLRGGFVIGKGKLEYQWVGTRGVRNFATITGWRAKLTGLIMFLVGVIVVLLPPVTEWNTLVLMAAFLVAGLLSFPIAFAQLIVDWRNSKHKEKPKRYIE